MGASISCIDAFVNIRKNPAGEGIIPLKYFSVDDEGFKYLSRHGVRWNVLVHQTGSQHKAGWHNITTQ